MWKIRKVKKENIAKYAYLEEYWKDIDTIFRL